jgi:hypothetical protein
MKVISVRSILGAIALLVLAGSARADQSFSLNFQMPVHVSLNVNETGCNNSPGPQVTLDGEIALGGLQATLTFQNNLKGTHTTVVSFETNVVLLNLGSKITIPKQPVLGGVGGNPFIWIQFLDKDGKALSGETFIGRCVQGLRLENDVLNSVAATALISAAGCNNNPGPYITFGGDLNMSGLKARLIFRNNVKGPHVAEAFTDVDLIVDGFPLVIPKQPVLGGAGGNPLIWVDFEQGNGDPITDQIFLGRCVQL